jgi:stringent starvation protein B
VFIHLDPRRDGVRVPAWFKKQAQLVLQVGLNMAVNIPDLEVQDDSVSCTLSFSRSPFFCYVPWGAVFALVGEDGKGMLWPDDIPKEVAAQQAERKEKEQAREQVRERVRAVKSADSVEKPGPAEVSKKKPARKRNLVAADAGDKPDAARARSPEDTPKVPRETKRSLPPYLRVVK